MYVYHLWHYFSILFYCETYKRAIGFGKIKRRITCFNKHAQFFFMERKNEQAKSIFRQSAILLARDNSKIFCVNWAHKKRLYYSYQHFSIFKNFRYSFVRFPLNQLKKIIRSKSMFWIEKLICIYILQNRAQNNF